MVTMAVAENVANVAVEQQKKLETPKKKPEVTWRERYSQVEKLHLKGQELLSSWRGYQDQDNDPFLRVNEARFFVHERIEIAEQMIPFLRDEDECVVYFAHRSLKLLMCLDQL